MFATEMFKFLCTVQTSEYNWLNDSINDKKIIWVTSLNAAGDGASLTCVSVSRGEAAALQAEHLPTQCRVGPACSERCSGSCCLQRGSALPHCTGRITAAKSGRTVPILSWSGFMLGLSSWFLRPLLGKFSFFHFCIVFLQFSALISRLQIL